MLRENERFLAPRDCIIFYNTLLLSRLLAHKEAAGNSAGAALLTHVSPVPWQHINFYGRYAFMHGLEMIDVDAWSRH